MRTNNKGFSLTEIVIVVAVVGIVGMVGWFVYQNKNKDTKTDTQVTEQTQPTTNDATTKATSFEIKELGVKFELSDSLSGLYYTMGNNNKSAYFSLNEFKDTDCAADKTAQVALTRYADEDFANDPTASKQMSKKIGNYYYMAVGGQAPCSEDESIQNRASKLRADIIKLLPEALVEL